MTQTDHWNRRTLDFIVPYLEQARSIVRVSTGFFTIEGYNLIRQYLDEKVVYLLVGYDEQSHERLRQMLIDDIMLHLSRWDEANRREAVLDLVRKLSAGQMRVVEIGEAEIIDARIRKRDHGKIYIIDDAIVLVGSSNLTIGGLIRNTEGVATVNEADRIHDWLTNFEQYWNAKDTHDLTDELLRVLMEWLELNPPYDVYLKTLLALTPEDPGESPRATYKMPVKYQQVVIERVIRQLKDWRGAFLVASTGLGKTIMATHTALRLSREGEIYNVIVFAPKQVLPNWEDALDSAGLNARSFTRDLLDRPASKQGKVKEMLRILERVDDKYIILIDESHHFRNQERATDGVQRRSFQRLVNIVSDNNPLVLLLTATPLAKGVDDLNNQLYLLPHTAPDNLVTESGQIAMPGFDVVEPNVWRVSEHNDEEDEFAFFDNFRQLPVCTVISTSQVAKAFATSTPDGDYIDFGEQRRWLPKIEVRKVKAPVPLENEMSSALDRGYFKHHRFRFQQRGQWIISESTIEKEANIAWASSPFALKEVVSNTIQGNYDVPYRYEAYEREQVLGPILDKIINMRFEDDLKLKALVVFIRQFLEQKRKVIVFTERRATAFYIEMGLQQLVPDARLASVVHRSSSGEFVLRTFDEVYEMILNFAPEANRDQLGDIPLKNYDVFI
ncbi:MAG: DEAD/DEAH box helicase family protein, partial [Chloroflexota bacterium]